MDPWSALAAASSILQVLDFGSRLLSTTLETYRSPSGRTSEHAQIHEVAKDLGSLSIRAQQNAATLPAPSPGSVDESFLRLCRECEDITMDLRRCLDEVKRKGVTTWDLAKSSLRAAFVEVWGSEKVTALSNRLKETREQMVLTAVVYLWEQQRTELSRREQFFKEQRQLSQMVTAIEENTRGLGNFLGSAMIDLTSGTKLDARNNRSQWVEALWNSEWTPDPQQAGPASGSKDAAQHAGRSHPLRSDLLQSLSFSIIKDRESAVPTAYQRTYKWILELDRDDQVQRSTPSSRFPSFAEWLEGDTENIYWITGKPGSGKSTLMKYILTQGATRERLLRWSGATPLVMASFYFWNAGLSLQKTYEGLVRTILYQCLEQEPDLIPQVCPKRWALLQLFGDQGGMKLPAWTWKELEHSLMLLAAQHGKSVNVAIFIDGLDEFSGDHLQLVQLLRRVATISRLKLCVSSRPWNVFRDEFRLSPSLQLENFTKEDIIAYVRGNLGDSAGFQEFAAAYPTYSGDFQRQIVEKAQGVFLWVMLVLRSLLEGFTEGDRPSDLQQRLDDLPADLELLFQTIWRSIGPAYMEEFAQYLLLLDASTQPLTLQRLWLASEPSAMQRDTTIMSEDAREGLRRTMGRRLNSRTKGLLEASHDDRVDFIHRTLRDWIYQQEVWDGLTKLAGPVFDPHLELCRVGVAELPWDSTSQFNITDFQRVVLTCLQHAGRVNERADTDQKLIVILDRLDTKATALVRYRDQNGFFHLAQQREFPTMHWASLLGLEGINSIAALAAIAGIFPYVDKKIARRPEMFAGKALTHLIHCAIFGVSPGYHHEHPFRDSFDRRRLPLVSLLLDKCSLEDLSWIQKEVMQQKEMEMLGIMLKNHIRKEPASYDYAAEVRALVAAAMARLSIPKQTGKTGSWRGIHARLFQWGKKN